jgi:hypothetical protein
MGIFEFFTELLGLTPGKELATSMKQSNYP